MDEEKLNKFLDFIENDLGIKPYSFQKELLRGPLQMGMNEGILCLARLRRK